MGFELSYITHEIAKDFQNTQLLNLTYSNKNLMKEKEKPDLISDRSYITIGSKTPIRTHSKQAPQPLYAPQLFHYILILLSS